MQQGTLHCSSFFVCLTFAAAKVLLFYELCKILEKKIMIAQPPVAYLLIDKRTFLHIIK